MSSESNIIDSRQMLERLARGDSQGAAEVSVVASPGARVSAWPIKIKSLSSYNVYNVQMVVIGDAGSLPAEIGEQTQAVNMAESFMQQGQLQAGTYAVMCKAGDKNIFYAPA